MSNAYGSIAGETSYLLFEEPTVPEVAAKPEATAAPFKVWIDAGHGGEDPGAEGYSGTFEAVSNLAIASKVYELLRPDSRFELRMTRTDDTFVELKDRPAMANEWQADVFVSIHGNAYEKSSVSGIETFYHQDSGLPLAEAIHGKLAQAMGFKDRGIRRTYLRVLALSRMPAVMIESGYLSNAAEEAVLLSEEGQARLAAAIVDGLRQYAERVLAERENPAPDPTEPDAVGGDGENG